MSNAVYPVLPGLAWPVGKAPLFNTSVQRSASLNELRASWAEDPLYTFKLRYEFLRDEVALNELKTLFGFMLARKGSWDSFLFTDDDDASVTAQAFGTGDGVETEFQLVRSFGNASEPVKNLNAAPQIYIGGVLQGSGYSVSATGLVTFTSAPAAAAALTWTGSYYFRCRFAQDTLDFSQVWKRLWETRQVEFVGSLGAKV